jgi:formate hydrogenlyase subunit 3/multisubunit Na+/H+ antiporter MnhD subunit
MAGLSVRTNKEIAAEALRRAEIIRGKRASIRRKVRGAFYIVACLVLITGISVLLPFVIPDHETAPSQNANYGTLFSDSEIGGYLLIGLISFVLGIAVTLYCKKYVHEQRAKKD